jgi:hypothetical protein
MDVSRIETMRSLWKDGLEAVETTDITVKRTFAGFNDLWTAKLKSPSIDPIASAMQSVDVEVLKTRVRTRLPADADGQIAFGARAHAIKGRRAN